MAVPLGCKAVRALGLGSDHIQAAIGALSNGGIRKSFLIC